MSIFRKWWFWAGAILALLIFRGKSAGADIYGSAMTARNTLSGLAQFIGAPASASITTAASITSPLAESISKTQARISQITTDMIGLGGAQSVMVDDVNRLSVMLVNLKAAQ
jgi:hypothetical protein